MPEYVENITGGKICHRFLKDSTSAERKLLSIYADATNNEASAYPADSPIALGHVLELSAEHKITRGMPGTHPLPLYPPMYTIQSGSYDNGIAMHGLVFGDVILDSRNYILKFTDKLEKECWFQVAVYSQNSFSSGTHITPAPRIDTHQFANIYH